VTYLAVGVLVAAAVAIAVALLVRKSVTSGALGQYVVPFAEPGGVGSREFVGGGVWHWGVRASAPLVRLEIAPDQVRIGPSNAGWSFLIPTLAVPRADVLSVAEVERPFKVRAVQFAVPGDTFVFIGSVDAVLGAVAAHPPETDEADSSLG
jgi:hypothetical protein